MSVRGEGTTSPDDDRLADAIRRGLDDASVDVASLLVGARRGARRIRRRRAAVTAVVVTAVVVGGVPVAVGLLGTDGARPPAPAATAPTSPDITGPTPSGPPTAVLVPPVTPSSVPAPSASAFATLDNGSVDVPLDALLAAPDLSALDAGLGNDVIDAGSRLGVETLGAVICAEEQEPAADSDLGGRSLYYAGDLGEGVVTSVRVLAGTGAAQVQDYVTDALVRCPSGDSPRELVSTEGLPGEQSVLALARDVGEPGFHEAVGSVREGGTVVSVSVTRAGTPDEVVAEARQLLVRAHEKLVASGLPQAYPG